MKDNEIKEYCLQESGIDLGRYGHKELTEIKDALHKYHNAKLKLLENNIFSHACWVSIHESQPKPQQKVYVVCENPKSGGGVVRFQTMAEYIPCMTVKEEDYIADEYHGDGDYNEEEDEYYTPEGFYEWQSEPEIHWRISAKVTHWMPLIALP
jgi:hypothetical protein